MKIIQIIIKIIKLYQWVNHNLFQQINKHLKDLNQDKEKDKWNQYKKKIKY